MITFKVHAIANKDLRTLARTASEAGWHIELTHSNQVRWRPPNSTDIFITPLTPRTNKSVLIMRSKLRQHGIAIHAGR